MRVCRRLVSCAIALVLLSVVTLSGFEYSSSGEDLPVGTNVIVRFVNGDQVSGSVVEYIEDKEQGTGFRLKTLLGTAKIFDKQLKEVRRVEDRDRHDHRVYVLPTAKPIGDNAFIGAFQGAFLYAGYGWKGLSVTAGRSILPMISASEQLSALIAKYTVYQSPNTDAPGGVSLAVGGNLSFVNSRNPNHHLFLCGSFEMEQTLITATIMSKVVGPDLFTISAGSLGAVDTRYANGTIGGALGFNYRLSEYHGVHIISELWNFDISNPSKSAASLGVRLSNTMFSSDFGLAFFTAPVVVPFISFSWTPF